MLKILQARFQQYMNQDLLDVQAGFRKAEERDQIANIHCIMEKQGDSKKNFFSSSLLTMLKPLTVWITTNCEKFLRKWKYQTTLSVSWEACREVRKQHLELDLEWWTGSKFGKENDKAVNCHPVYLTCVQNTSHEMLHKS